MCADFAAEAKERGAFPFVCAEKWTPGGKFGVAEAASCGMSWGSWRTTLHYEFPELVDGQVERCIPQKWKSAILFGSGAGKDSDGEPLWAGVAREYLSKLFGDPTLKDANDDELAAICCALYGLRMRQATPREITMYMQRLEQR